MNLKQIDFSELEYTPEMLEAVEKSIQHWEDNVQLAKAGALNLGHIYGDQCALCSYTEDLHFKIVRGGDHCDLCPLRHIGAGCCDDPDDLKGPWLLSEVAPWQAVSYNVSVGGQPLIDAAKDMRGTLKLIRNEMLRQKEDQS